MPWCPSMNSSPPLPPPRVEQPGPAADAIANASPSESGNHSSTKPTPKTDPPPARAAAAVWEAMTLAKGEEPPRGEEAGV
mmetsp:Transcript_4417/g.9319  ORF Transcript_4417/g.9319 Transcript_4417/m.9319 type:complete len:80 (+) Transcript_4417:1712-1951(+)